MTTVDTLQDLLAAEHAAIYVYGVLGGRASRAGSSDLGQLIRAAYEVHRARRGQLGAMITDVGADPVAAQVAYELATPARTEHQLRSEALGIEQHCAATYAAAVATVPGGYRRWAALALGDAAVRGLSFGGEPAPFPGAADLADQAVDHPPTASPVEP